MLYASSKSDIARLDNVARFTGVAPRADAGAKLLELTNQLWRGNTPPSRFITDSMVATWLDNDTLRRDMPDLSTARDQYRLLAWYCCARPMESGCRLSREPVDPILGRMSHELVAESANASLPYTALMMSVYHYRSDLSDAVSFRDESPRPSFLGWYYSHGIRELGIIHHVSSEERAVLNATAENLGYDIVSLLCLFALEWMPHPDFNLSSRDDRIKAWQWFTDSTRREEPFASLVDAPTMNWAKAGEQACRRDEENDTRSPGITAHARSINTGLKYRIKSKTAVYFDRFGTGSRLLFEGEWFGAEEKFSWSHAPWSTLLFQVAGPIWEIVSIGLLLSATQDVALLPDRQATIFLNGHVVWRGLLRDATNHELIFRVPGGNLRVGSPNLLQFHVSEPFVPAELMAVSDTRMLGIALRRLWIDQARTNRGDLSPVVGSIRGGRSERRVEGNKRLLVLRGDLRSHTGYAKATRALAKLVPERFRVIGVDIHPDPADNQAVVPFPIVTETEALLQVVEQVTRCVVVHCSGPDSFAVWPNAKNVGWFFWETDTVPHAREWPLRIALMDAIWAPTSFMAGFIRSVDYHGPVHAVAWPDEFANARESSEDSSKALETRYFADLADPRHPHRVRELTELRQEARLLFVGVQSLAPRKGLPLLLSEWRAYIEASGGSDILVLRLAFRHALALSEDWQEVFLDALATAGFRPGSAVRIAVIPRAIPETELNKLYRSADAFVSMTYGEGFGGPILEAIQNECPVIAPRHTGLCDLIPEGYPLAVANRRIAVALKGNLPAYPHSSSWYIPEAGSMQGKLAEFAAMTAAERRALVERCRRHAMSFCWAPVVRQKLATALEDLDFDRPVRDARPVSPVVASLHVQSHAAD